MFATTGHIDQSRLFPNMKRIIVDFGCHTYRAVIEAFDVIMKDDTTFPHHTENFWLICDNALLNFSIESGTIFPLLGETGLFDQLVNFLVA